jgi:hypothetical protein
VASALFSPLSLDPSVELRESFVHAVLVERRIASALDERARQIRRRRSRGDRVRGDRVFAASLSRASRGASMATLNEKKRDSLKSSTFGLPEERKYPMPDKSHARNAKARASQQVKQGNLTIAEEKKIDRKADRVLNK